MTVTDDHDFVALKKRLSSDYVFDVSLKYEDKEGGFSLTHWLTHSLTYSL